MEQAQANTFVNGLVNDIFCSCDFNKVSVYFSPELSGFVDGKPTSYADYDLYVRRLANDYEGATYTIHDMFVLEERIAIVVNFVFKLRTGGNQYISSAYFLEVDGHHVKKIREFNSLAPQPSIA